MRFILQLPAEVLDHLGNFLDERTLLNIVLVCRLFHQYFTPRIWNDVVVNSGQKGVKDDTLRAHAKWVHSLHLYKVDVHFNSDYSSIIFPRLILLKIECCPAFTSGNSGSVVEKQDANWARLVRLNPTVQDITLHLGNQRGQGLAQFLEAIFTTLPYPKRLELIGVGPSEFAYGAQQFFWKAVSRFEELEYWGFDQSRRGLDLDVDLSQLKHLAYLTLTLDGNGTRDHDLRVLRRCRGLTRLRWLSTYEELPVDAFLSCLEQSTWPLLEDLTLDKVAHTDEDFAAIIRHVPPLKHLRLKSTTFGPVCFGQLRVRHFDTLRTLCMDACEHFSSWMALDVLLHCPRLENFKARYVSAENLLATPQPWACHGLRRLEVSFDGYIDVLESSNRLVFEHLSRLTLLEEIDVRARDSWGNVRFDSLTGMLQWRLDFGLEQLSPLRRLRSLRLDRKAHDLSRWDVEWMLDRWPLLERIYGDLSKDWELEKELTKFVRGRGIFREIWVTFEF